MKVIFTQDYSVSLIDDIKVVKPGYARFLLRYGKAVAATPNLVAEAKKREAEKIKRLEELKKEAMEIAKGLTGLVLEFTEKTDGENLYGSVWLDDE